MQLVLKSSNGIDLSNVAALTRGGESFADFYARQLRIELSKLLQIVPTLHLTGWDGGDLESVKIEPRLEVLWPSAFNGSDEEFRARYTYPLGNVRVDCPSRAINTGPTIQLGPVEVIRLFLTDQLAVSPGKTVHCPAMSARIPNDGRTGSFCFGRTTEGTYCLSLFDRQSLIEEGEPCAVLIANN